MPAGHAADGRRRLPGEGVHARGGVGVAAAAGDGDAAGLQRIGRGDAAEAGDQGEGSDGEEHGTHGTGSFWSAAPGHHRPGCDRQDGAYPPTPFTDCEPGHCGRAFPAPQGQPRGAPMSGLPMARPRPLYRPGEPQRSRAADGTPPDTHPVTPDGRNFVVRGRLWRRSDPALDPAERAALVQALMAARRAKGQAMRQGDPLAREAARGRVEAGQAGARRARPRSAGRMAPPTTTRDLARIARRGLVRRPAVTGAQPRGRPAVGLRAGAAHQHRPLAVAEALGHAGTARRPARSSRPRRRGSSRCPTGSARNPRHRTRGPAGPRCPANG